MKIDQLQTPCYVIDEKKMRENLEILKKVQEDTGSIFPHSNMHTGMFFHY